MEIGLPDARMFAGSSAERNATAAGLGVNPHAHLYNLAARIRTNNERDQYIRALDRANEQVARQMRGQSGAGLVSEIIKNPEIIDYLGSAGVQNLLGIPLANEYSGAMDMTRLNNERLTGASQLAESNLKLRQAGMQAHWNPDMQATAGIMGSTPVDTPEQLAAREQARYQQQIVNEVNRTAGGEREVTTTSTVPVGEPITPSPINLSGSRVAAQEEEQRQQQGGRNDRTSEQQDNRRETSREELMARQAFKRTVEAEERRGGNVKLLQENEDGSIEIEYNGSIVRFEWNGEAFVATRPQ